MSECESGSDKELGMNPEQQKVEREDGRVGEGGKVPAMSCANCLTL